MPQAIPIILAAYGASEAVVVVATIAVGLYESDRAKRKARAAFEKSLSDRLVPVRSGIQERVYLIGAARLSGTVLYIEAIGDHTESLDIVLAIANNECELVGWYLNEDFIAAADFPGTKYGQKRYKSVSNKFTNVTGPTATVTLDIPPVTTFNPVKAVFRAGSNKGTATIDSIVGAVVHLSGLPATASTVTVTYDESLGQSLQGVFLPGTTDSSWFSWGAQRVSPGWDDTHQMKGICGSRTLFNWDENIWESGPANVGLSVVGKAVAGFPFYDPRTSQNLDRSTNPAIVAGWWLTLPRGYGGCGIPSAWIDWQSISAAANICDELITVRNLTGSGYTTIKRYQCDLVISTGDSPLENLDKILSAMAGRRVFTGGLYKVVAGAFRPATLTITDADIIGDKPILASTGSNNEAPPNICTANFVDASDNWREKPAPIVKNAAYIAADGHEEQLPITLPATQDARRANYLQGIAIEGARPAHRVELYVGGVGENIAVFDCVQLNIGTRPHLAGITFEVVEIEDFWDGSFCLRMAEIRPQTWALDPDTFTPSTPITPPDNSYLFNPSTVAGFAVAAITPQTLPDGTSIMRVDLTWNALPDAGNTPSARIELRYRLAGGDWVGLAPVPADQTSTSITAALIDGDVYQFQARYVNGFGAASAWLDAWTQISGAPLPSQLSVRLRPDSTIFRVPATGNAVPTVINLAVIRSGLAAAATFTTNPPGITLGGSGDNRTLAYSAMGANESVQITCTITQSSIDYVDVVTILKVHDGADANTTPDPTPPPTPTGLSIQSFVNHLLVAWTAPVYTQGRGHDSTIVYAAQVTAAQPTPTFANAVTVGSSSSSAFVYSADPGTTWAFWLKHQSKDGYLSTSPAGGTNGLQGTTAKIGNINLGPLIVQAGNLVDGAVTGPKISAASVDITKFASGLEPVTIITGALPTTNVGRTIYRTDDALLYRWNGSAYVSSLPAAQIAGQLSDSQIATLAAAKLTGQVTATQITDGAITTPKLAAGSVTTAALAADSVTATQIAAGAVTASEIAANAVTAAAIAAGAIVAGKIAAGAVSATEIAAGAITASKIAVTGRGAALNDDPTGIDSTAWQAYSGTGSPAFNVPSSSAPAGTVLRLTGAGADLLGRQFPIVTGKRYRVSAWLRKTSGTGNAYFGVLIYAPGASGPGAHSLSFYPAQNVALSGSYVYYSGLIDTPPGMVKASIYLLGNLSGSGDTDFADMRVEEVIPGELIVDGSITARKLLITGGGGALNDDPETTDITAWNNYTGAAPSVAAISDVQGVTSVLRSQPGIEARPISRTFSFDTNKTYRVRGRVRSVGANGTFYLIVELKDASGVTISQDGTHWFYPASGVNPGSSFTQYEGKFGAGTGRTFPSNGRSMAVGAILNYQGNAGYMEATDLLIEEAVDFSLIVDGAIRAQHLAANSIAVGTAAVQNGAIVNAMIANAAIDDAKILNLTVNKISGGTLGADIAIGAGRITYDNGTVMRVQGTGFGTSGQFVDWFGPRTSGGSVALCSEANATYYLKTNGQAYFGGSLSAGVFKNAASTTDTSATASVVLGPFLTNGNAKTIVVSYQYTHTFNCNASTGFVSGSGSATIVLEISTNNFVTSTTLDTLNVSQTGGTVIVDGDPAVKDQVRFSMSGAHTITNLQGATNNMYLRARVISRSLPTMGGTSIVNDSVVQITGFVSTE